MTKHPTWERGPKLPAVDPTIRYRLTSLDGLRAAMLAHGFTAGNQLSKATGVKVSTVNHLVHGRRNTASPETVRALREVLGADARDLFVLDKSTVHADAEVAA